jgi:SAM-dependent methyltransferase
MAQTTYEEMPYATFALRLADPNRLAAIARLYGVEVPAPDTASVLEIGCGTGTNIIHLAERYPGSRCVGVDISERHIAEGHKIALGSSCSNVELRCGDIRNAALGHGEFDYIICHGVYSWVAPSVRQHLLSLIASSLSENGIALVSYNVLPGWRSRGILRDIMQTGAMHRVLSTGSDTPETRLDGAMELLRLVAEKRGEAGDLYGTYIREGIERFQDSHPSYLFHEYLEECNEPFLFSTFMRDAELHGLQFVSEAKPSMMSVDEMGEKVASYLDGLGGDIIAREQCIDVLRNRMFRETIVCRGSIPLKRDLKASVFTSLYFVSDLRKIGDEERDSIYRDGLTERIVRTPKDEHSALLHMISEAGYAGSSFQELKERFTATTAGRHDERAVMHGLVRLWRWGLIDVALERAPIGAQVRGEPRVSRLARYQALTGERFVTSLQHRSFELTSAERDMVVACDGTRRLDEMLGESSEGDAALGRLVALGFLYE